MSAKPISEFCGKEILYGQLSQLNYVSKPKMLKISAHDDSNLITSYTMESSNNSLTKYAIKPDQLIKRRGKHGLIKFGPVNEISKWFNEKKGQEVQIGKTTGRLNNFIVEPFCEHSEAEEMYLAIYSERDCDTILFYKHGGVNIGDIDAKAQTLKIPVSLCANSNQIMDDDLLKLLGHEIMEPFPDIDECVRRAYGFLKEFIQKLYCVYMENHFTYLEINPLVVKNKQIFLLDLAAKLDETALFLCSELWKTRNGESVEFPAPFGRDLSTEETYIAQLDSKTGASLKLTIFNRKGRIWTMVAGGGASVVFTDTVCDLGGISQLANYGEYSGDPSESLVNEYAKTILSVMTEGQPHPDGKVLIIGGSIANFTNVAATFKGIVGAVHTFQEKIRDHRISIYVRRGGPNYQEGLRRIKEAGTELNLPIYVYGPETHMTNIVAAALKLCPLPDVPSAPQTTGQFLLQPERNTGGTVSATSKASITNCTPADSAQKMFGDSDPFASTFNLFEKDTQAIVWGQQAKAIQGMLDYDFVCGHEKQSVVASTYPFSGDHKQKFYFGHKEILIPSYKSVEKAILSHPKATVMITFASFRSVYDTVREVMNYPQIRVVAIIAEGVPENLTRKLIKVALKEGVTIIGPATVGGIMPGRFKIGNTGGMMDNILASKLYRPGSVAYVSRSGGMSNELNNIISRHSDGVFEGVAIGGDRYPGSTFIDHLLRYEKDGRAKIIVLLGEIGGDLEYEVVDALKANQITKPLIAWCIGTCADHIISDVQFGHAGASANASRETATAKNDALSEAGAIVPDSFEDLGSKIAETYATLLNQGIIIETHEVPPPAVPMDYAWARELGLIRKPASFMTSICDERGEELLYAGMPISKVLEQGLGIGGVLSLLWFQKRLPDYANKFIEICLMITADHGPAVSGAHNCIVCARAGKDLVSSVVSGLLTIGDRFGGALDGAARQFTNAFDKGFSPMQFVNEQRRIGKFIMGIGHRVKSVNNPDKRVEILKHFALDRSKFSQETPLLEFALKVEEVTTAKKPNLILNIDGMIGVIFVDILRHSGMFTPEEAQETIDIGALNGLFVLGRSLGFIGHYLDQRRLKQGLYRHPWDDITYVMPEGEPITDT